MRRRGVAAAFLVNRSAVGAMQTLPGFPQLVPLCYECFRCLCVRTTIDALDQGILFVCIGD